MSNINNTRVYKVAIIDDDLSQRENIEGFFELKFEGCSVVEKYDNPDEPLKLIRDRKQKFDLVLVDYLMPQYIDGLEFTKKLKEFDPEICVIMITSNTENNEIIMDALTSNLLHGVFDKNRLFHDNGESFIMTVSAVFKFINLMDLEKARTTDSIKISGRTINAKSRMTEEHCEQVGTLAIWINDMLIELGGEYGNLARDPVRLLNACLMHDVGKIYLNDRVIDRPGELSEKEQIIMKEHPLKGAELFENTIFREDEEFLSGIRDHHERHDGSGYRKLVGENIPVIARIIAIADSFDALTNSRVYKPVFAFDVALGILIKEAFLYDKRILEAFFLALEKAGYIQLKTKNNILESGVENISLTDKAREFTRDAMERRNKHIAEIEEDYKAEMKKDHTLSNELFFHITSGKTLIESLKEMQSELINNPKKSKSDDAKNKMIIFMKLFEDDEYISLRLEKTHGNLKDEISEQLEEDTQVVIANNEKIFSRIQIEKGSKEYLPEIYYTLMLKFMGKQMLYSSQIQAIKELKSEYEDGTIAEKRCIIMLMQSLEQKKLLTFRIDDRTISTEDVSLYSQIRIEEIKVKNNSEGRDFI